MRALVLVLLFIYAAAFSEAQNLNGAVATPKLNHIIVIDSSSSMSRYKEGIAQQVSEMISNGLNGRMRTGDIFAIWTLNDQSKLSSFPIFVWIPEHTDALSTDIRRSIRDSRFQKSRFKNFIPQVLDRIQPSDHATITVFTDGETSLSGTRFDDEIQAFLQQQRPSVRRIKKPLIIMYSAAETNLSAWTAGFNSRLLNLPSVTVANPPASPPQVELPSVAVPEKNAPPPALRADEQTNTIASPIAQASEAIVIEPTSAKKEEALNEKPIITNSSQSVLVPEPTAPATLKTETIHTPATQPEEVSTIPVLPKTVPSAVTDQAGQVASTVKEEVSEPVPPASKPVVAVEGTPIVQEAHMATPQPESTENPAMLANQPTSGSKAPLVLGILLLLSGVGLIVRHLSKRSPRGPSLISQSLNRNSRD